MLIHFRLSRFDCHNSIHTKYDYGPFEVGKKNPISELFNTCSPTMQKTNTSEIMLHRDDFDWTITGHTDTSDWSKCCFTMVKE